MFLTCKTPTNWIATFLPSTATVSSCEAITHSRHAMISLRKSLSSHLIRPRRSAVPKDSKDREDDDTSRSRQLLILHLLLNPRLPGVPVCSPPDCHFHSFIPLPPLPVQFTLSILPTTRSNRRTIFPPPITSHPTLANF